eukprot:scaffold13003_cov70-Phaeocystis_antarctica.AAC.5
MAVAGGGRRRSTTSTAETPRLRPTGLLTCANSANRARLVRDGTPYCSRNHAAFSLDLPLLLSPTPSKSANSTRPARVTTEMPTLVALFELSIIAVMLFALEWSTPGFLPVVCVTDLESVAECASGPVAATLVLLAVLFLLVLHSRRELAASQRAARDEAKRKHEIAWDLMAMRNNAMHSDESVRVGRAFQPQPSDVFVVTYPKCGTTWVTQILHALRTGGSMDFGEITEVVPWDILAHDCGQKLDGAQVWP